MGANLNTKEKKAVHIVDYTALTIEVKLSWGQNNDNIVWKSNVKQQTITLLLWY